jgi:hypothetical protein
MDIHAIEHEPLRVRVNEWKWIWMDAQVNRSIINSTRLLYPPELLITIDVTTNDLGQYLSNMIYYT